MSADDTEDYVWYAPFGSNLSSQRFAAYLTGQKAPLSAGDQSEAGARNSSPPVATAELTVANQLYFAYSAAKWDGAGVAFLHATQTGAPTQCRLLKITLEQFEDVHRQEAGMEQPEPLDIARLRSAGSIQVFDRLYGLALHLGDHADGDPIITITTSEDIEPNPPAANYLLTIATGLAEFTDWPNSTIAEYLATKPGAEMGWTTSELTALLDDQLV